MMNKLKNRVTLLWGNTPLRYCFSFSLIASGVLFSFISINVVSREIMVDITIAAGLVLIPNFNKVWYRNFFVKFSGFLLMLSFLIIDLLILKNCDLENPFFYFISLILSVLLLTCYTYFFYKIFLFLSRTIKTNTGKISKVFKYCGITITFLTAIAALIKTIIDIYQCL